MARPKKIKEIVEVLEKSIPILEEITTKGEEDVDGGAYLQFPVKMVEEKIVESILSPTQSKQCNVCEWFVKEEGMCFCTYYPKKTFIETENYRCSKFITK